MLCSLHCTIFHSKTLATALIASSTSFFVSKGLEMVGFSRRVRYFNMKLNGVILIWQRK